MAWSFRSKYGRLPTTLSAGSKTTVPSMLAISAPTRQIAALLKDLCLKQYGLSSVQGKYLFEFGPLNKYIPHMPCG